MVEALDDGAVGQWYRTAVEVLSASRSRLDDLNVFPVPDGDTGTNLLLTAQAAVAALDPEGGRTTESAWSVLARGAVLMRVATPARSSPSSCAVSPTSSRASPRSTARFRRRPAEGRRHRLRRGGRPRGGDFLSGRAGAESAVAAVDEGRTALPDVVRAAADGARAALEATPGQLAVLREAPVVDAGGAGLCLVLDALVTTVTGVEPARPPLARRDHGHKHSAEHLPHAPPAGPGSEVQYLLADTDEERRRAAAGTPRRTRRQPRRRRRRHARGREWNVHVHVADVGAAIEAGIEAGRRYRISVTPLAPVQPPAPVPGTRAVVAVVSSDGLAELFAGEASASSPRARRRQEDDVLEEVLASTAYEVVVLPNDAGFTRSPPGPAPGPARSVGTSASSHPVTGAGARRHHRHRPRPRFGDDVIAMAEAAAATRWAEVTVAEQEALTSAGLCQPGDALGSAEGDVVVLGGDLDVVACDLLDRMLSAGGELATLVVGDDEALGETVCRPPRDRPPHHRGQPVRRRSERQPAAGRGRVRGRG